MTPPGAAACGGVMRDSNIHVLTRHPGLDEARAPGKLAQLKYGKHIKSD